MSAKKADRLYRRFWGRGGSPEGKAGERVRDIKLPREVAGLTTTSRWVDLGKAKSIAYEGRKAYDKNELTEYVHKFGPGARLLTDPDGVILVIVGPRLKVKDVGITG